MQVVADAFVRARRFLRHRPWSTRLALIASISQGALWIGLVAILGLFVDLIVHQGRVPDLTPGEQQWLIATGLVDTESVSAAAETDKGLGLLSLAVRTRRNSPILAEPFLMLARWFGWTRSNGGYLAWLVLLGVVLSVAWCLVRLLLHAVASSAVVEVATRLRRAVHHQAYRLGTLDFRALGTSGALGLITRHVEAIVEGIYTWLTVVFREPAQVLWLLSFAFCVEALASGDFPWLSSGFVLLAFLFWLVEGQLTAYLRRRERRNAAIAAHHLALVQENLQLQPLAKCYLMERFNQSRLERHLARYAQTLHERYRGKAFLREGLLFIAILTGMLLMLLAGWTILRGKLGAPATLTVLFALASLFWPIWNWFDSQRVLRRARRSAEAVFAYLDRQGEVGQVVGAEFLPPLKQQLEFNNVTLLEPGTGRTLLQNVSFRINAGERVALVGADTAEKHALVYLLPRFLDPKEGEIRIDGHDIRWVTLESLRVQVALVLLNNLVFNDTVINNIGCGDPSYTLPQVMEAAKVAHAHQFIQRLPNGYETRIGELGCPLSIGQKFRIALARAILRDPALAIIEEPTVTLDDETKAMLDDTYLRFLPERTTIFLPHRLSTIKSCNRVLLLDHGRLVASGTHRDLLAESELYRHLQYIEFNVFAEHT